MEEKEETTICCEEKLVSMLGYHIVGPDGSNRYRILDEQETQVGFIQYKKLFKKNKQKGTPPVYGYHMEIESDTVSYKGTREINSKKALKDIRYFYEFDIKREGEIDHIALDMSAAPYYPYFNLWSKTYGYMSFGIDYEKMHLNFKGKTEHFYTEETITVKIACTRREYEYTLAYCNRLEDFDEMKQNAISIGFQDDYYQQNGNIEVIGRKWRKGKLQKECSSVIAVSFEDAILTEKDGINAFSHFRYLIGEILPFKKELISEMLELRGVTEPEYLLFLPDLNLNDKQIEENIQKVKK